MSISNGNFKKLKEDKRELLNPFNAHRTMFELNSCGWKKEIVSIAKMRKFNIRCKVLSARKPSKKPN